jgi:hypothetical protein
MVQEKQAVVEFNGAHQLLFYADDVNKLRDNTDTVTDTSDRVGPYVNTKKTKYSLLSPRQNAGPNHYIKIENKL